MAGGVQSGYFVGAAGFLSAQEVDHLVGIFEVLHLLFDLRAEVLDAVVGVMEFLFEAGRVHAGPLCSER